ncbi:hypothetical protein EYF80_041075 [Liparis tanakae]|uniref:Secreted protein n=1 Tax=Liparis tanakae TaxID=230148 RepID=A0A4Z2G544_9TELE|nr:hypothetical protein EYF80_041075 [Liparis tanakae]
MPCWAAMAAESCSPAASNATFSMLAMLLAIAQVQDEAVSLVEAVPADRHLRRPDRAATFDLEQPLHDHLVGDHVLEPGGHAPFLGDRS